jgi:hypothetical protein
VRLDHLLSKEQLSGESRTVARDLRMSGRGAQRRRHWPVCSRQRPANLVQPLSRGVERDAGAAGSGRQKTAPCWVLKEQPMVLLVADAPRTWRLGFQSRHSLVPIPLSLPALWLVVWGLVGAVGLWVGRWLRITQWTRASCFLWLSCQGRTVDALAPGADEGRGRPR